MGLHCQNENIIRKILYKTDIVSKCDVVHGRDLANAEISLCATDGTQIKMTTSHAHACVMHVYNAVIQAKQEHPIVMQCETITGGTLYLYKLFYR